MNVPTGQCCPPSIGMVAAFKLESLAGIVGIRNQRTASTYIFGAVCPHEGKGAALIAAQAGPLAWRL